MNLQNALAKLEDKLMKGVDIKPHLSTKILDLDYYDDMLIDWGIFHLHLGIKQHPKFPEFVDRTKFVLFVIPHKNTLYFINCMNHSDWTKKENIEILHRNWPEIIKFFKVEDAIDVEYDATEKDIKTLRKCNINPIIKLNDGSVYFPTGLGKVMSGNSLFTTRKLIKLNRNIINFEKHVEEDLSLLLPHKSTGDVINIIVIVDFSKNQCSAVLGIVTYIVKMKSNIIDELFLL